ncbi:uncharacterized protein LOC124927943 [Impatiens glandulifera]|uniref:uncharacterized protein LOC124927943 n=1 Tax=Impatiens glandulifera TaxID=253017 RepID=UPI001FB105D4|nr:uncharacterized protein LOC124927943 [Impatiens glandulifera]
MGSSNGYTPAMIAIALLLVVVLLPMASKADNHISPALSPLLDEICKEVNCGKGSCKADLSFPFNYKCECDAGWKRTHSHDDDEEDKLEFLPCIIPNCSLDYSCMPAAPPAPAFPYNISAFDPCYWTYCGEGTCVKNSTYIHTCQCNPGYSNLLNVSVYPCYSDCAIGSDCAKLGIVSKSTSSSSSPNDDQNASPATSSKFLWVVIALMSTVTMLWRS